MVKVKCLNRGVSVSYLPVLWSGKKIQPQKMVLKKGPVNLMVEKISMSCSTCSSKMNDSYTEKVAKFISSTLLHLVTFSA